MAPLESTTADSADDRERIGIPKFVKVPDGLKKDDDGKLELDENDDPIEATKTLYVQRTGDALKQIIERAEGERDLANKRSDAQKKKKPEEIAAENISVAKDNIDFVYEGLSLILFDPESMDPVDPEWLSKRLDFTVASMWMEMFVPSMGGGGGNSLLSEPDSDEARSTDTSTLEPELPATEESTLTASTDSSGMKEQT